MLKFPKLNSLENEAKNKIYFMVFPFLILRETFYIKTGHFLAWRHIVRIIHQLFQEKTLLLFIYELSWIFYPIRWQSLKKWPNFSRVILSASPEHSLFLLLLLPVAKCLNLQSVSLPEYKNSFQIYSSASGFYICINILIYRNIYTYINDKIIRELYYQPPLNTHC